MGKKKENIKNKEPELIKYTNDDTDQVKKFILILVGVAIVAVALYFLSSKVLIKDGVDKEVKDVAETIEYTKVDVGNIFNRPYEEYYVLAYDPNSLSASIYSSLIGTFNKEDSKIYFLDLSTEVNKAYVGDGNKDATKASEISLKEPTLIKITNGKITAYLEDLESIEKELSNTK